MPSDLQRVAQALVECLDEIPNIVGSLQRRAAQLRQEAGVIASFASNNPAARVAALQLDAAARSCEEAAHIAAMVPPKARAWAMQMVSGARTEDRGPVGRDPTSGGGGPGRPRRLTGNELLLLLPERRETLGHRPKTTGAWQDDKGTPRRLISGQHDPEYEEALDHARKLDLVKEREILNTAADVELKFAMKMRREGIMKAVIAVNKQPCTGDLSCDTLLKRFLPPGAELIIYGPDGIGKPYIGEAEPS